MNFICWNCRGAASKTFPGRVRDLVYGRNISVLILLETRVSGVKADRVISRLGFDNWIRLEATGYAGGIWILWQSNEINLKYLGSSTQFIHAHVTVRSQAKSFLLTCVYAEPCTALRQQL